MKSSRAHVARYAPFACFACLILVLAVSVLSCSGREDAVLAEFKDRSITVGEFEDAYGKVAPKYLPKTSGLEGFEEFLNTMLHKEVMAYKADELGYDKDATVVQGLEAFRNMGLQAAFLKIRVADKVTVKDEQVREHYRNKGVTLQVKQLLLDTPDEAEDVYQILKDGADFDTACKEYSKGPDAEMGGQVLSVSYGQYGPGMQRSMFALPVGGFTEPQMTAYGFFIVKILKRTEAKNKEPFDDTRETLEQEVRVQNEMIFTNVVTDKIREDAGVTWFWDNLGIPFRALPPDRSYNNPPDRRDEVYPLLFFDEEDLDKPLVTYKNKTITVKDFSDFYDRASFFTRPRLEFRYGAIKYFLTERIMNELVVEEMERSRIEEHPEVRPVLQAKHEELMINRLWDDMINQQTVVTNQMVRDYYNDNREVFRVAEKRRFGVILTGDLESAQKAYDEVKSGKRFRTVAMAYSIDEVTRETLAETDLLSEGEQPVMDRVGFALERVGQVSEPFETSRGWMVLKLTERADETFFTFAEAEDRIRSALKQIQNDERLDEQLKKWKEELGVVIHKDRLNKIQVAQRGAADQPQAKEVP
jgi:parvulin-like peptidyl-prolyl isomerase